MKRLTSAAIIAMFIVSGVLFVQGAKTTGAATLVRGVNLAGLEFGDSVLPGTYGTNYVGPTAEELDYFNSKGTKAIRLPFRWERVQQTLYGPLDSANLAYLDTAISEAGKRGMKVLLDPHNYGRYKINGTEYIIGSPQVPREAFYDFWKKLAAHYANESAIYAYGLINEPHDMGPYDWKTTAQGAVNAIREVDRTHTIDVPGDGWSGAWCWSTYSSDLVISDPASNLIYEAHQYFDGNGSGAYWQSYDANGAYPNIGVDRLNPFLDWLHANGLRGIIGEYGVADNDSRWLTVMDNFLTKLDQEGMDAFYWAAGPWWGNYPLSIDPSKSYTPQMGVIQNHLGGSGSGSGTSQSPTPTATSQALSFTATGSANPDAVVVGGATTLNLSIKAAAAGNVLVDMEVYDSGGNKVFQTFYGNQSFAADATKSYAESFAPSASGTYTLKAGIFSNDWAALYNWSNDLATFTASTTAPTATPTPVATSTPQPTSTATPKPTSTSTPVPTIPPAAGPRFTTTGNASPHTVNIGQQISLHVSVKTSGASDALVDLEVYDSAGRKVFQQAYANQSFTAGETKRYTTGYTPSAPGIYTLKVGIFNNDWSQLYDWLDSVSTFRVRNR